MNAPALGAPSQRVHVARHHRVAMPLWTLCCALGSLTLLLSACQPRAVADLLARSPEAAQVTARDDLPADLLAQCQDDNGRLADPGAPWLAGNVIWNASLPRHRLLWAVTVGRYHVVHFERGGFAHTYRVLVATGGGGGRMNVALRADTGRFEHYAQFAQALRTERFEHVPDEKLPVGLESFVNGRGSPLRQ